MTDTQLQLAIAKMLPEKLTVYTNPTSNHTTIFWNSNDPRFVESVRSTEWEHIVRLVEEKLNGNERLQYISLLVERDEPYSQILTLDKGESLLFASWQQRATAILKVKGEL